MPSTIIPGRAKLYVAAVISAAVLAVVVSTQLDPQFEVGTPPLGPVLTFLFVGLFLELAEHHLAVSATGSIAFIIFLAAALVFGPTWGAAITAASFTGAHLLNRRPLLKTGFNVSQYTLSVLLGSGIYLGLRGEVPPSSLDAALLPFGAMVVTFFAVNSLAVSGVVALSEGRAFREVWRRNTWSLAAYDVVASSIALAIAILYSRFGAFAVAGVVAPVLFLRHIYMVNLQLQSTNREMLDLMVKSIEARDPYTSGHSQRVAALGRLLARELGLGFGDIDRIATAALLHDVGKMYEEFAPLLRKESQLSPEEYQLMRSHPIRSAELVGTISTLRGYVERAVRHHHENYDGTGYPDGLARTDIPIAARIIMVADTVDAMTSHRPYRRALSYDRVTSELSKCAGQQFDPVVVRAFHSSSQIRLLVANNQSDSGITTEPTDRPVVRLA